MMNAKLAHHVSQQETAAAAAWARRAGELLGEAPAAALDGAEHRNSRRGVVLCAQHLKQELKKDDLHRWAADLGRLAKEGGLRADQLLAWFIAGRISLRDRFESAAEPQHAAETEALMHALFRSAQFFDQASLNALAVYDAERKGHAHPADAPHLFK